MKREAHFLFLIVDCYWKKVIKNCHFAVPKRSLELTIYVSRNHC